MPNSLLLELIVFDLLLGNIVIQDLSFHHFFVDGLLFGFLLRLLYGLLLLIGHVFRVDRSLGGHFLRSELFNCSFDTIHRQGLAFNLTKLSQKILGLLEFLLALLEHQVFVFDSFIRLSEHRCLLIKFNLRLEELLLVLVSLLLLPVEYLLYRFDLGFSMLKFFLEVADFLFLLLKKLFKVLGLALD